MTTSMNDSGPRVTPAWWFCVHSPPCEMAIQKELDSVHHHRSLFFWILKLKIRLHNCAPIRAKVAR